MAVLTTAVLATVPVTLAAASAAPAPGLTVTSVAAGLGPVTAFAPAPGGDVFVATKSGQVRLVRDGAVLPDPVLELEVDTAGERGLVGLAITPDFATEPRLVVHYTATEPSPHNRVSVFGLDDDQADADDEEIVLDLPPLVATVHNGGAIGFGPDGALYVAVGENDVGANAPDLTTPLGKILRVDLDGTAAAGNPYAGQPGVDERVWASGLRNPYSFTFGPDGQLVLFDVGEDTWEEVNIGAPGADYGWPATEGPTTAPGVTGPVYAYSREGGACSIIGGAVTSASGPLPAPFAGRVVFGDFCAGWVRALDLATGDVDDVVTDLGQITAIAADTDGTLLVGTYTGTVVRLAPSGPDPVIPEVPVAPLLGVAAAGVLGLTMWSRSRSARQPTTVH